MPQAATHGASSRRVLFMSRGAIGDRMAGPGIRAYELAKAVSRVANVKLAAAEIAGDPPDEMPCVTFDRHDDRTLLPHLAEADIVVAQPQWPLLMTALYRSGTRLVFDLYDPEPLETLEYTVDRRRSLVRDALTAFAVDRENEALKIGHWFICASETQRDLWLGAMLSAGLIRPGTYDRDPSFRSVIDTVPFGVPVEDPELDHDPWKGFAGIDPTDEVVLWNGGIWGWFDPATAIKAIADLSARRPGVRLVFMGASGDRAALASEQARSLAADLGLLGRVVFFYDQWVPYAQRGAWLLSASCALSCHIGNLETRFAFRTRLLDCFWAGLPIVCTEGDPLGAEVERHGLGKVVAERDPVAVAGALERVLDRGKETYADGLREAADRYRWPRVAEPLLRYVLDPNPRRRLGARRPRRVGHQLRNTAYSSVRRVLNAAGVNGWPGWTSEMLEAPLRRRR